MKKGIILIFIIVIIISGFFVYKDNVYKKYKIENNYLKKTIISKDVNITTIPMLEQNHITVDNIKFKNIFLDYTKTSQTTNTFEGFKYDEMGALTESFKLTITPNLYTEITTKENYIDKIKLDFITTFLKQNNIKNDIDLFLFLRNYKYEETNMFSNINKLKEKYLISSLMAQVPYKGELSLLKGSYTGIIKYLENGYEIEIVKGTKLYKIEFIGKDVTNNRVEDLLRYFIIR